MQVSVESKGNLGRRLTITIPKEEVAKKTEERLKRIGKSVKLPGFRPGKVPMNVIRSRYLDQAMQEAAGELIETNYREAVVIEELNPAGQAQIDMEQFDADKDLVFVAEVELVPEVKAPSIQGKKVETVESAIDDADVNRTVENIMKQYATWDEVNRKAKEEDRITLDYTTKGKDLPEQGMEGEGMQVILGSNQVVDDFEKGIKGIKAGDEKSFDVTFPADYGQEQLQGKKVKFTVKCSKVEGRTMPELSEEFLTGLGLKDPTEDGMRTEIRNNLERELQERLNNANRDSVFEAVIANNDFEVPAVMVEQEARQMIAQMKQQTNQQADGSEDTTPFKEQAARRVKLSMLVSEYISEHKIELDEALVDGRIDAIAQTYDDPQEFKDWVKGDTQQLNGLRAAVMEQQVVDKLLEDAKITPIKKSFLELVESAQG